MHYSGSISPPREPAKKKFVVPRRKRPEDMTGGAASSSGSGVKESSLVWPMLERSNYVEWVMMMQCNREALEI
jgi:hypothetical protein